MSDVIGFEVITLRPGDSAIPYSFEASPASSQSANDGAIPYGTSVSGAVVTCFKNGVAVTDVIEGSDVSNNIIQVQLNYPDTNKGGKYELRFALTLDTGAVINKRFDELYAEED